MFGIEMGMLNFQDLSLHATLIQNLLDIGYEAPTAIQASAIPLILEGHDLLGIAQTGTGKTAAFALPILQHLIAHPRDSKKEPRVLILAPTRELCSQIEAAVEAYAKNLNIKSCAIYGGVGQGAQVKALRDGVDIIVATPGRLLDLLEQKLLRLSGIERFVLDEADRMLDMGFIDDIKDIIGRLPSKKQTLLFSATMPPEIQTLASKILKNPQRVEVSPASTIAKNIQQRIIFCRRNDKYQLLKKILKEEKTELVLVFTRTRNSADTVVEYLAQNRMASRAIHGEKDQSERERAISNFKEGAIKILVATDIASRGIDIEGVSHVINFDIPSDPESYVHRIGRTARAGKEGVAISFCDDTEKARFELIQAILPKQLKSEKFEGSNETVKFKTTGAKKVTPPTPGKSQEKTAWLDHSKRQAPLKEGEKRTHPGFKKTKKKR